MSIHWHRISSSLKAAIRQSFGRLATCVHRGLSRQKHTVRIGHRRRTRAARGAAGANRLIGKGSRRNRTDQQPRPYDHIGNNDLLQQTDFPRKRHLIAKDGGEKTDIRTELYEMYGRGIPYLNYVDGLPLPSAQLSGLLAALGAPQIAPADLDDLGRHIRDSGLLPALNQFVPSIVVDVLVGTYPAVFPSLETMKFLEGDISVPQPITLAGAQWTGWSLGQERPEIHIMQSAGHSKGGVVFYIPEHKFLMLADETSSAPIWPDTDPRRVLVTARNALTMFEQGGLTSLCAGHFPIVPSIGPKAVRASLERIINQAEEFAKAVTDQFAKKPAGLSVDEL